MKKLVVFTVLMSLMLTAFEWNSKSTDRGLNCKDVSFEQALKLADESEKYVFMDAYASWCGPCKTLGPIVEDVAEANEDDNVAIVKVNVEQNTDLAKSYGVRSIPTIVYIKEGEVVNQTVGIKSQAEIEAIINEIK